MKRAVAIGSVGFILGALLITACHRVEPDIWVVERDVPQTRNLIPVLNRSILLAAGPGAAATCGVTWRLAEPNVRKGAFWPEFGTRARMGLPVFIPEGFPAPEPRVLEGPETILEGEEAVLRWSHIELEANDGVAIHATTWLGPPDMFHTREGMSFGDIHVDTAYEATVRDVGNGSESVTLTCRLTLRNTHSEPVEGLEFAFFLPRALLDNTTGGEIPLLESFAYRAEGFSDAVPLDLLIIDGLGRGAWGPRFTVQRDSLGAGESISCFVEATGMILEGEALIVPLVSLVARVQARYWPSSEVEVNPPGEIHYSDYTHFNLVVADSRLFRLKKGEARVETSSPEVRRFLGTGLSDEKDLPLQ